MSNEEQQKDLKGTTERPTRKVRKNGWTFPLHPLQFMAWFFYFYFLFTLFTLLIPNLTTSCDRILCYTFATLIFLVHFVIHILSVTTNPADDGVTTKCDATRGSRIFPLGTFDRTKHEHVIENQFCYICEVSVSSKAKHCSVCNKCVQSFDHHCKWLNNCVGGKNYRLFLACVVTAFLGSLIIFSVSVALVVTFFSPYNSRNGDNWGKVVNGTSFNRTSGGETSKFILFTSFGSSSDASDHHVWISVVILTAILSAISFLLLGHLLLFHLYLYHNKMSTYDFIMKRRREQTEMEDNNNEKHNDKRALLSTSYFFACCSTKIERMKRSRKVQDESNCKNFRVKKKQKKKWFKRNITALKPGKAGKEHPSSSCEKDIESVDGIISAVQTGFVGNSSTKRTSIDSAWSGTHGDVYIGSPERRVLESRAANERIEQESQDRTSKAPLNKRQSNLRLQISASEPFASGSNSIQGSNHDSEQKKDDAEVVTERETSQRRASETAAATTSQRSHFFNEQQQRSMNERQVSSIDRSQLMSRLCDRRKSIQSEGGNGVHKRVKRDPKVQQQLIFRQHSIEQMINTQKLFHQLPGISRDGVKSRTSNGHGSIFGDGETCDDNEVFSERV